MRSIQSLLLGALIATTSAVGCGSSISPSAPAEEATGESRARLSLAVQGSGSASLQVTATDAASGEVVLDKSVDVTAGSATLIELSVAPASYTFNVQAFADAAHQIELGTGSAEADLGAGQTTDVSLTTTIDASGTSASVAGTIDVAPQIIGVTVTSTASGSLGQSLGADAFAELQADAVAASGGELSFFWSGFGINGAVQGSSTIDLSAAAAAKLGGPAVVQLVVQDSAGATAETTISVGAAAAAAGVTATAGGVSASASAGAGGASAGAGASASAGAGGAGAGVDAGASAGACLQADTQCEASCNAALAANPLALAAQASCLAACSLSLASCSGT